jgi:lysophospholipase L1-like esterase
VTSGFAQSGRAVIVLFATLAAGCGSKSPTQPTDQFPTGPKITCPDAPPPATATNGQTAVVQYGTATFTGGGPNVSISCAPPNGSLFPIGSTAVVCTASDARQRTDSCSFNVVVRTPPRISVTRFVAFGDSITWGEDGRSSFFTAESDRGAIRPAVQFPSSQTYPGALQQSLQGRYTTQGLSVTNAGLPGEKAGDSTTPARFNGTIAGAAYEAVLLMEGSNDIASRDSRDIPPAVANLRTMIRNAKSRNMRAYLATVPPMVAGRPRALPYTLVPELNAQIRSAAAAEGITLVDIEAGFGSSFDQYIGFDGLHPNETGYAKIAEIFFNTLRTNLELQPALAAPTSLPFFRPRK